MWSLFGRILRISVVVTGAFYVASRPNEQFFSARILQFIGISEKGFLAEHVAILDFFFALLIGLSMSHAIFWSCIVRRRSHWPRWGGPALRMLDYVWYTGAAIGLVYIAAGAQFQLTASMRSDDEAQLAEYRKAQIESIRASAQRCTEQFSPLPKDADDYYRTVYDFVHAVCPDIQSARGELFLVEDAVLSRCDKAYIDYSISGEGQQFPKELWDNRLLLDTYTDFIGICFNDYYIRQNEAKIAEIGPFETAMSFSQENKLLSGYVALFAIVLGFRLARTTAEVVESIRTA